MLLAESPKSVWDSKKELGISMGRLTHQSHQLEAVGYIDRQTVERPSSGVGRPRTKTILKLTKDGMEALVVYAQTASEVMVSLTAVTTRTAAI